MHRSLTTSFYGNPYYFTGRQLDILDNGSLKIQYNRNRYYDHYTGRWLTHDPLGITPNPPKPNVFLPAYQYKDGLSLYEYVRSRPVGKLDRFGLHGPPPFCCGPHDFDSACWGITKGTPWSIHPEDYYCAWVTTSLTINKDLLGLCCGGDIEGKSCNSVGSIATKFICRQTTQKTDVIRKPCYIFTKESVKVKVYMASYFCTHRNIWAKHGESFSYEKETWRCEREQVLKSFFGPPMI